ELLLERRVVSDSLQEVEGHVAAVEHGVDADEAEHGVVAAEGEPAPTRPAAAAPPGDGHAEAAVEEAVVQPVVDRAEVMRASRARERREGTARAPHAVEVVVHEAPNLAVRAAARTPEAPCERLH